jgi:NADH:ubiquinone oxidoreductase subunit 6 (subunit J)
VEFALFIIFGAIAVATGFYVIVAKNPINSAISLIGTFLALAGVYVLLDAHFMAVIQVLVYAGAIMVLFLFVIMLLSLSDDELGEKRINTFKVLAVILAAGVLVGLAATFQSSSPPVGSRIESFVLDEPSRQLPEGAEAADLEAIDRWTVPAYLELRFDFSHLDLVTEAVRRPAGRQLTADDSGYDAYRDVTLVIRSDYLAEPGSLSGAVEDCPEAALCLAWADIAALDDDEDTTADTLPPAGRRLTVELDLSMVGLASLDPNQTIPARAELGWAREEGGGLGGRVHRVQATDTSWGGIASVGRLLFSRYALPFEVASVLLLVAMIGAIMIAKKRL